MFQEIFKKCFRPWKYLKYMKIFRYIEIFNTYFKYLKYFDYGIILTRQYINVIINANIVIRRITVQKIHNTDKYRINNGDILYYI